MQSGVNKEENAARLYSENLKDSVVVPFVPEFSQPVFHLYVIRTKKREALMAFLKKHEIFTGIHYPIPIHLQKAYEDLGYKEGDFPITEKVSKEILSLPIYPEISEEQIVFVCEKIKEFLNDN